MEMLQDGMAMKPGLLPTVVTLEKRMETTSMMAMAAMLAVKAASASVMVLAIIAVKVSHHRTSSKPRSS